MSKKFALIHIGVDVVYSLTFVAQEIIENGHEIKWFDGEEKSVLDQICAYRPDYICFSPLTTFFNQSLQLAKSIKNFLQNSKTIFGGHHVSALPELIEQAEIDFIVLNSVYQTIPKIIKASSSAIITGDLFPPQKMKSRITEYFSQIPRIGNHHRKPMMSHFGCMYNCSYCANSQVRKTVGSKNYKTFYLERRTVDQLISEAKKMLDFKTKEICIEDDDILAGSNVEEWLSEFASQWQAEVKLPIYANITPNTVIKASNQTLSTLSKLITSVTMGIQAARPESLKLFNRQFQNEEQLKHAFNRLSEFKIKVKLELIIGLPVDDPIGDAIDTIKLAQRVGSGTFAAAFPLMLYPNTNLHKWCLENKISLNDECEFEWYTGVGSVKFDDAIQQQLQLLSKLATFLIKYNIDEGWIRSLIKLKLTESSSRSISEHNYLESLVFRQGQEMGNKSFQKSIKEGNIRF